MLVRITILLEVPFLLNFSLRFNTRELNSTPKDGRELFCIET